MAIERRISVTRTAGWVAAGALVLALESYGTWLLADFREGFPDLLVYFALHGAASAMLAWMLVGLLPRHYQTPRWPVHALLFSFAFFIPLLGVVGMLVTLLIVVLRPKRAQDQPFEQVTPPEYVMSLREPEAQLRISSLKAMLLDPNVPAELRLRSLNALQNMPTRAAAPTLRRLLGDPLDELRLIAYGMLDQKEKGINAEIQFERRRLQEVAAGPERLNVLRRLVELNWELIYSDLVQGDVRAFHLAQVDAYAQQALALAGDDPGLLFLRARGLQAGGELQQARAAFLLAIEHGLLESRALAYLAEIAFEQRDFVLLRSYLERIGGSQASPVMAPLISFWIGKSGRSTTLRAEAL